MWLQQSMGFAHVKFLPSNPYTITGHVLGPSEAFRVRRKLPPEATRIIRDAGERDLATSESPPMAALKRLETPILHVKAAYKPANTTFPKTGDWISLSPPPFPKRYSEKKKSEKYIKNFSDKTKHKAVSNIPRTKNAVVKHTCFLVKTRLRYLTNQLHSQAVSVV